MKVVMLEAPEELIAERRRKGHDRFDEVWEGVLHMVPPPSDRHQRFLFNLGLVLAPHVGAHGLVITQSTGLFRPGTGYRDYRQPDLLITMEEQRTKAGAEGAEVVFEILSPNDESREKLPFYESLSVKEVFLIDPETRAIELYRLSARKLLPAVAEGGGFRSVILDVSFRPIEGPKLRVRWTGGEVTI